MARVLLYLKLGILSFSVLCAAMVLKLSLPLVTEFAYSELPLICTVVMTWLRPPYLYIVINGIIITIVASSKFHRHKVTLDSPPEILAVTPVPVAVHKYVYDEVKGYPEAEVLPEYAVSYNTNLVKVPEYAVYKDGLPELEEEVIKSIVDPEVQDKRMMTIFNHDEALVKLSDANSVYERIHEDEVSVPKSPWNLKNDSPEFLYEKPPVSARTGNRKAVKSSSEGGKALRVSKPKRQETLETTWKTITEGHPMPLTRHPDHAMTKSETFHSSSDGQTPGMWRLRKELSGSWKLKKDPSLSQDELNRRVEAFISKFNEDMRLQRQESLNQYMEMIHGGAQSELLYNLNSSRD